MIYARITTTDGRITLGHRIGRLFWFSTPATFWRTSGTMVSYRGDRWIARWCVGRVGILTTSNGARPRWHRAVTADQQRRDILAWQERRHRRRQ